MKTYEVHIPTTNGPMTVELTAQQFSDFHDQLTAQYLEIYDEVEAEINKD